MPFVQPVYWGSITGVPVICMGIKYENKILLYFAVTGSNLELYRL